MAREDLNRRPMDREPGDFHGPKDYKSMVPVSEISVST